MGRSDCAEGAFHASLRANPRDPSTYVNLGRLYLQTGRPGAAAEAFGEALAIDATSGAARDGLAQARTAAANR
jgi:cytochrome c-type biogenesis protein CcmH/NrfG